jgi:superfamily II DNA or RNA helicase
MIILRTYSPCRTRIEGLPPAGCRERLQVESALSYKDKKAVFALKRFKNSAWLRQNIIESRGEEAYLEELRKLKEQQNGSCLLSGDETYSGLGPRLQSILGCQLINEVEYPDRELIPWDNQPKNALRDYQREAVEKLLAARHGAVELATGLGKSTIILYLVKALGLPTVVMAPSRSIANQLYADFRYALGGKRVGFFGDGKKDCSKLVTIAIAASLVRVDPGSQHWEAFQKKQVFIADESHLTPAATLQQVCFGLLANAPYRLFFSATQMRNDGLDVVLEGITGPVTMRMSTREGIDGGFLAKPHFRVVPVESEDDYRSQDIMRLHRHHFVNNRRLAKAAATLANMTVDRLKTPCLILIDELPQFSHILPHLRHKVALAHAADGKKAKEDIPAGYQSSDVDALVKDFNAGNLPILVGTSCVSTGTDFTKVGHVIYMVGGGSEIALRQAIGRGTRKPEGKSSFIFTDFDVVDVPELHRQADARRMVYADIWEPAVEVHVNV